MSALVLSFLEGSTFLKDKTEYAMKKENFIFKWKDFRNVVLQTIRKSDTSSVSGIQDRHFKKSHTIDFFNVSEFKCEVRIF